MKKNIIWIILTVILFVFLGMRIYLTDAGEGTLHYYEYGWEESEPIPYAAGLQNQ